MIGAMAPGPEVLPPPATFDFARMIAAMMIHSSVSIVYEFVIGWIVKRMTLAIALLAGAAIGIATAAPLLCSSGLRWPATG